jgi:fluoride ion exporter CrcB/FEX
MQVELLRMIQEGSLGLAAAYAALSVAIGLAAVALGSGTGRRERVPA